MGTQTQVKVVQTRPFRTPQEASAWVKQLGASFRKTEDGTGLPLFKTAAGVVLRLANPTTVEVLSNCVC
jgi:hypothetical protein